MLAHLKWLVFSRVQPLFLCNFSILIMLIRTSSADMLTEEFSQVEM